MIGARARRAKAGSSHTTVIRARSAGSDEGKAGQRGRCLNILLGFFFLARRRVDSWQAWQAWQEASRCRPGGFQEVSRAKGPDG